MNKLLTIAYLAAWLLLANWAAHGQTVPPPIYCRPDVITAMRVIWQESGNGTTGVESSFIVNGTPGAYSLEHMPLTGERNQQHVHTYPGQTFAMFHVHPNMSGIYPSTPSNTYAANGLGDTGYADKGGFDIYVVSRGGLTVYRPSTKEMVLLRSNLDWTEPKGCF